VSQEPRRRMADSVADTPRHQTAQHHTVGGVVDWFKQGARR
jgi:hypothetical protein